MKDRQGEIFFEGEGDRWFSRNAKVIETPAHIATDLPLRMLSMAPSYRPRRVLEIGCSTGWRLAALRERYGCACVGVEPSSAAIEEGKRLYGATLDLRRGLARDLPIAEDETFDLVVVALVFHWVSRDALLRSVAEVDRVVAPEGHLILMDFLPAVPLRRNYHHLPDGSAFTYKQEIARMFLDTSTYRHVARATCDHAGSGEDLFSMRSVGSNERVACDILQKDVEGYAQI